MFPLVDFPTLVQHYALFFSKVFSPEAFIEFKRYISGLIVSENKTVDGINRLFVNESRNQSSLNRLLTASPFSLESLNQSRLKMLDSVPGTRLKHRGVLSIDDSLLIHFGQSFEQIAKLFDPVSQSYVWAHDLVTLHYSDDLTDYPLLFELWQPPVLAQLEQGLRAAQVPLKAAKEILKETAPDKWRAYLMHLWGRKRKKQPELEALYDSKVKIAQSLLRSWVSEHPDWKWPVTFDNWYTQPDFCRFLDQILHLSYVGTLAESDEVILQTGKTTLKNFAARLKKEHQAALKNGKPPVFQQVTIPFKGSEETYYSYCQTHHIHNMGKQRLVINYRQADLGDNPIYLISNRLVWQAPGITRVRRHRWSVEVYHEEGKAEGLDQYQLRDFGAIQRHVALVAIVYSLLRTAQQDRDLREKLQEQLKVQLQGSAAFWRRSAQAQSLWCLGLVISAGLAQGLSLQHILVPFIRAICGA
jgi:hypothetical protein